MKNRFTMRATSIAAAGAMLIAVAGVATFANAAPAPAPAPCATVGTPFLTLTQPITEPDSGTNGGNWANDTFTENVNVWQATDGSGTFCADGNTTNGTFTTTGPDSPQNSVALSSGITGTFTGGETWVFPAGTATTTSASSLTLAADNSATGSQFNNWQSQVFNATGQNVGASTYSFTYVTPNNGTWTNADATSGGNSGDITGAPVQATVSGIAPTTGPIAGGTSVVITGTGFTDATAVDFGSMPATITASSSDTSLTATSPATTTAGVVDVTVTTPGGVSATSSSDQFTYTTPVSTTPTVISIAPTTGTTAGSTSVIITGTNLTGVTAVDFGAMPATITASSSDTSITATSPATTTAGMVDVTVTTPDGTSATSSTDRFTYTAPIPAAPVISDIMATAVGTSTATISWSTDVPASSQVMYGTTTSYGATTTLDTTMTTSHSVLLAGLSEATLYHFDVSSGDAIGTTTSADNEFDTESTSSTTPLAVTGVTTVQGNATADGTFADGFQWIMHLTVPSVEDAFRMAFSDFTSPTTSSTIPADGNIMIYSPESSNASTTASAFTETGSNVYSGWMYLNGDTATTTAGRQINVYIGVAVPIGTSAGTYSTNFTAQSTPSAATSTTI